VSIAAVALEHRLNANLLRRWVVEEDRARAAGLIEPSNVARPSRISSSATFVPVEVRRAAVVASREIVIELRRGATVVKVSWPVDAAAACSSWLGELLR
jgi:hypothetical protein